LCGEYINETGGGIITVLQCDICTATMQGMNVKTDAVCEVAEKAF
jgi:hypothetical protein